MSFSRKAQVSLFVIAGLVLVVVLALALMDVKNFNSFKSISQKQSVISNDYVKGSFEQHLNSCLKSSLQQAVFQVAGHSGYLSAGADGAYGETGSSGYVSLDGDEIPVLLDSSGSYVLSSDDIMKRICRKTYVSLDNCFATDSYVDMGFIVEKQALSLPNEYDQNCRVVLKPDSVLVFANYSVLLAKDDFRFNLTEISAEVNLPLKILLDDAYSLINQIRSRLNNTIDLSEGCSLSQGVRASLASNNVLRLEESVSFVAYGFFFQFGFNDFDISGSC